MTAAGPDLDAELGQLLDLDAREQAVARASRELTASVSRAIREAINRVAEGHEGPVCCSPAASIVRLLRESAAMQLQLADDLERDQGEGG